MFPRRVGASAFVAVVMAGHAAVAAEELEWLTVGVGVVGAAGAAFIDAPADQTVTVGGQTATPVSVPEYPGFAGPAYGLGPYVDLRLLEYGGLQIELLRARDRGRAQLHVVRNGEERDFSLELSQESFHLPLLFKGLVPTGRLRPMVLLGPELVLPLDATARAVDGESPLEPRLGASAVTYVMFTWGFGGELELPVPGIDLRLAATLRGSVTPTLGDERMERATYFGADVHRLEGIIYQTRWRYQALGAVAVGAYF